MLTPEENAFLCRVGPRSPMGNLVRRYWLPALESNELIADGPPLRVRLLGEDLVAFRSTLGTVALIQNACPHRGASLYLGRNEEEGLRCAYHGWKFDCSGQCVDMPNVPQESSFHDKICARVYPCVERNGVIWTYMGPQPPPSLPEFGTSATGRSVCVRRVLRKCNWVQALEGDIDSSHLAFAHRRPVPKGDDLHFGVPRKQVVVDTEVGCSCAAVFDARETVWFALISHFLFPFYVMVPFGDIGRSEVETRCWVPLDDEHTLFWDILFLTDAAQQFLDRTRCEYLPASSDPLSRFNPVPCSLNDYLIDREMQRTTSFMGMTNVILEDQALTESMGPICDRSQEHLGSADTMIIHTRRRLIESARELQKNGVPPPGVQQPDGYRRRAVKLVVSAGSDVFAAAERLIFAQDS